ncbi:hypothetical protein ABKV19_026288 [Rosa sericea]
MALGKVKELVSSNPVVIFSNKFCPYCVCVKQLFVLKLGVQYKAIELDQESDGSEIQSALAEWTGQHTLPNVFVGGYHIGDCDSLGEAHRLSPESPLSHQDLVSWKMALEKRHLPEADRKVLHQISGFIDTDKIHPDACPALVADLSGEQGIIALAFGYTRLFQPNKPVTKAQAAIALATGEYADVVSEELARIEAETMAEKAVDAHRAPRWFFGSLDHYVTVG